MEVSYYVPVKPLVKAYLEYNFGVPVRLNYRNRNGKFFINTLQKKRSRDHEYCEIYPKTVKILIDESNLLRSGFEITKNGITDFNNFITECVYSLLFVWLDCMQEYSSKYISEGIRAFCRRYNFEPDSATYESLKKAYYRYRKQPELQKKYA